MPACNAILVKPNQVGTVSEAMAAVEAARAVHWGAIVSARSGETEDVTIVHLAVGWGVLQLKVARFRAPSAWRSGMRRSGSKRHWMAGHASPVPSRGAAGWPPERR